MKARPKGHPIVLLTAGLLLAQLAWIFAFPAFMGMDEFDHAFRAASVADGHLAAADHPVDPELGRGDFIAVPRDIAIAAGPGCEYYTYTLPANCRPTKNLGKGEVEIASAAARYNPAFYLPVGLAAKPFHGTNALYAMRAAAALLCAALLALAIRTTLTWSTTRWPIVAILLAVTPTTIYSTTVAAPNGLELISGILLWTSLIGWSQAPEPAIRQRRHMLRSAALGTVVLANTHSLGPLWIGLTILAMAVYVGPRRATQLTRLSLRESRYAIVLAALGCIAAVAWLLTAHTNDPRLDPAAPGGSALPRVLLGPILWFLQSIAAFPNRNDAAPAAVYVFIGALLIALFIAGMRHLRGPGSARPRRAIYFVLVASAAIPILLTIVSYRHVGFAWQGRYGLPFSVGAILLCGLVLDRAQVRFPRAAIALLIPCLALCDFLGQRSTVMKLTEHGHWWRALNWEPPATGFLLLAAIGSAVLWAAAMTQLGARDEKHPVLQAHDEDLGVIDVLLPFYGDPGLMRATVRSVLAQTSPDWRLVVVDDGYPDEAVQKWFASIDDPRVEYHRNEVNLGANRNYTRALELARATHVVMMGADDLMLPDHLQVLEDLVRQYPAAAVIETGVDVIDERGNAVLPLVDRVKRQLTPRIDEPALLMGEPLLRSLLRGNWTYFPSLCWQRNVITELGFRPAFHVVQDLGMLIDVIRSGGSMALTRQTTFQYRRHAGSDSSAKTLSGCRFEEERDLFRAIEAELHADGFHSAARAARLHLTSRLHAAALIATAVEERDGSALGGLLQHSLALR